MGMANISPHVPPGLPPTAAANRRTTSWPTGSHVGLGWPWPWRLTSLVRPKRSRFPDIVSELSWACMTRAMTVRSDQARRSKARIRAPGSRASAPK